ncbi:putative F-box protein At5g60060 [Eucalyptus grandis]|uniref:putative F-box protein At5g60060 n=1 Tax=Eucalyptus grandis TaxID=71139 RepID=UPI00192EC214|nr:putative F-box protein At5g60060 [Eucalyptus grandis]
MTFSSFLQRLRSPVQALMEGTGKRPWSDLPPEILSMIGDRLHTRMDVLRFRGVCSSFRSSIPRPGHDASRFPFRIPTNTPRSALFLRASTVYAVETPDGTASSGRARWLLKLEESEPGRMRILSLFSRQRIAYLPHEFPEVLDSLQFRIVEICREYTLEYGGGTGGLVQGVRKVVMHPDCVGSDVDRCSVYFIDGKGRLGYWRYGDENWSHIDDSQGSGYDDIAVYDSRVCVVDQFGSVSEIDSSFGLQSLSPPIYSGNHRGSGGFWKQLVVSSGDLYLVDRYTESIAYTEKTRPTCDFRVYRLDRQWGRWEEARSLGDPAFFLCKHCSFAVSALELGGGNGNCIYYTEDTYSHYSMEIVKVFSLADRSIKWLKYSDWCARLFQLPNGHA